MSVSVPSTSKATDTENAVRQLLSEFFESVERPELQRFLALFTEGEDFTIPFERYADDILVHCTSQVQAERLLVAIEIRLEQCRLELHPTKCRIVYCKDDHRRGQHEHISFDFLGYTFRPRLAKNRRGQYFVGFTPAVSGKAGKAIRATIRGWRLPTWRNRHSLNEIAGLVNPVVRGWITYYGRFHQSALRSLLRHLDRVLVRWACRKYKRFRGHPRRASHWLGRVAQRDPALFAHWRFVARKAGQYEPDEARASRPVL